MIAGLPAPMLVAPMLVAPMTGVSNLALTDAVTRAGVAGSFPVHVAESTARLDEWLSMLAARPEPCGPVLPNLVVHRTNPRRDADLRVVCEHAPVAAICSVGSPAPRSSQPRRAPPTTRTGRPF